MVIASSLGCSDGPTQPAPPTPTPTPTPIPGPIDLNGEWTGTVNYGTYFYRGGYSSCPDESIQVQVTQLDSRIWGNFRTTCAGRIYLVGTLGFQFDGAPVSLDLWSAGEEILAGRLDGRAFSSAINVSSRATTGATKLSLSR